ncbi:MAG: SDR family oxidoreductase [Microthrixaceae bacterium]
MRASMMEDKVVVITGGNSGIGFETALALASAGARVVLGCRNPQRADDAVAELRTRSGNDTVESRTLDLGDLESVRSFSASLSDLDRIDVLINNAGLVRDVRDETAQGFEMVFGTNHLGHFLLTEELLDQLRAAEQGRIINVASFGHSAAVGGIQWSDIGRYSGFNEWRVYGDSKLANILHAEALARRLEGTKVVTNSLHPGSVYTNFGREGDTSGWTAKLMDLELGPVRQSLLKTPAEGAQTSIHLATSAEGGAVSGGYWSNSKPSRTTRWSRRHGDAEELWHNSKRLIAVAS